MIRQRKADAEEAVAIRKRKAEEETMMDTMTETITDSTTMYYYNVNTS